MLLNRVEKALMNNPVRAAVQRLYEGERLMRLGGPAKGKVCLEIGCGRGVGAEIILDRFGAARVDAFDLDADIRTTGFRLVRSGSLGQSFAFFVADKAART